MTLEHNENIRKPMFFVLFGDICEESGTVRLPQRPPQRPKSVLLHEPVPEEAPWRPMMSESRPQRAPKVPGPRKTSKELPRYWQEEGTRHGEAKPD